MQKVFVLLLSVLFISCTETLTTNASDAYIYWSGAKATTDITVDKGQYWQSAHFTREYIVYLKLKTTDKWWQSFIEQNKLEIKKYSWNRQEDTPQWFKPLKGFQQYGTKSGFDQGSSYFRDPLTGESYIYEIQL